MNINKKQINIYTAVVFGAVFFMCMSNNIVGPLLGDIMAHYDIRLDGGGLMSMYQNIGGTAAIILFSFLMDRLNKTVAFTVPMLFLALSMLLIGIAPPYAIFMLMFLFFGISFSTMDMTGNALVSDVQQKKRDSALSLMHGIASIGAVAAPLRGRYHRNRVTLADCLHCGGMLLTYCSGCLHTCICLRTPEPESN